MHPKRWSAIMAGSLIAGATALTASAAASETLTMWPASHGGKVDDWMVHVFPTFVAQRYPDIQLDIQVMGSRQNLQDKRIAAIAAGVAPDIFEEAGNYAAADAVSGQALALDSLLADWEPLADQKFPYLTQYRFQGRLYGMPFAINLAGYGYWNDMLQDSGVAEPTTWNELLDAARRLTITGGNGKLTRAGLTSWFCCNGAYTGLYTLNMLDRELGSALFSADFKSPRFNTPQGLEALTYAQQLYQVMVPGGATPTKSFDDRGAAMMWWYGQPYTANLDPSQIDQLRLARIPAPTAGGNTIAVANSWGWMISPQANSPQAAAKVIEVFLSPEVQQSLLAAWGPAAVLSPRRDVSDPSDSPLTRQYAAMTVPPISDWGPTHPLANDVNRIAEPIIEQAVEGKLPLGAALAQVDDLLASEFKSKGFTQ